MDRSDKSATRQIVPAGSQALAVRSSALVVRGLRDLARDSNWLIKKVFAGRSASVAISDTGIVCAIPAAAQGSAQRLVLFDIEMNVPMMALAVPETDWVPPLMLTKLAEPPTFTSCAPPLRWSSPRDCHRVPRSPRSGWPPPCSWPVHARPQFSSSSHCAWSSGDCSGSE